MSGILLPVSDMEYDKKAFEKAAEMAKNLGMGITLLNVQNIDEMKRWSIYEEYFMIRDAGFEHISKKILENAMEFFNIRGLEVETIMEFGNPAEKIIEVAQKIESDYIIINSHRIDYPKRFLLGSVTSKVVHHSTTPVIVIK